MEYEPWEIWNGGDCPCPNETAQVHLRCETRHEAEQGEPRFGLSWRWSHEGLSGDIIAFRRVKKPETVTLYGGDLGKGKWAFGRVSDETDRHRLIFEVVNGEPVNPRFERIE